MGFITIHSDIFILLSLCEKSIPLEGDGQERDGPLHWRLELAGLAVDE